jgi:hypothetical protein
MSKKLMLLAAGALAALAFAALPALASAAEFKGDCGSGATCNGTVTGTGNAVLQDDSGGAAGRVVCTGSTGTSSQTHESPTGTVTLTFTGCEVDKSPGGLGECENQGVGTKKIAANQLVSHLIYLEPDKTKEKGILLTGVNVTFTCHTILGTVLKTVTGNIIGEIENPECGKAVTHHTVKFEKANEAEPKSPQKWMQITTLEPKFDLTSGSHAADTTTSSQTGTGHIAYTPAGQTVKFTC